MVTIKTNAKADAVSKGRSDLVIVGVSSCDGYRFDCLWFQVIDWRHVRIRFPSRRWIGMVEGEPYRLSTEYSPDQPKQAVKLATRQPMGYTLPPRLRITHQNRINESHRVACDARVCGYRPMGWG